MLAGQAHLDRFWIKREEKESRVEPAAERSSRRDPSGEIGDRHIGEVQTESFRQVRESDGLRKQLASRPREIIRASGAGGRPASGDDTGLLEKLSQRRRARGTLAAGWQATLPDRRGVFFVDGSPGEYVGARRETGGQGSL